MAAALPAPALHAPTEAGRQALAAIRAQVRADRRDSDRRVDTAGVEVVKSPWVDMPHLYRRMVVAAAGLPAELVDRRDRELTEREKVMMRSAISDMRTWLGSVAAL
jgi:hypothetical protein